MSRRFGRPPRYTGQQVLSQVLDYLAALGLHPERRNTGAAMLPGKGGQAQMVRFGQRGDADINVVLPNSGITLHCEAKATGELPSVEQGQRILEINTQGGLAMWCSELDVVMRVVPALLADPARRIYYTSRTRAEICRPEEFTGEVLRVWPRGKAGVKR